MKRLDALIPGHAFPVVDAPRPGVNATDPVVGASLAHLRSDTERPLRRARRATRFARRAYR
ncbi:MAG: hypothetical protein AAGH87_03220 [Pseudomonadota bacterium]